MKVQLELTKAGKRLHHAAYHIDDPESFGAAWQDVWVKARERFVSRSTSIGALMDTMHEGVIEELNGAKLGLRKL